MFSSLIIFTGAENTSYTQNWNRTRDTRSVEPSVNLTRNFNTEKIQSKPPSGRRHSTVGIEYEERHKNPISAIPYFYNLPPRFQKKYFTENNLTEENWDGSSITFQGHLGFNGPKSASNYYQSGSNYNTLPNNQHNFNNSHMASSGYHTLPNRPRGRGRLQQYSHDTLPGHGFRSRTPDVLRSPSTSRPETPTGDYGSMDHHENRRFNKTIPEEKAMDIENREFVQPKQYQGSRSGNEYAKNRDDKWAKRDDRVNKRDTDVCEPEKYRDKNLSFRDQDRQRERDRGRETPLRDHQERFRDQDRNRDRERMRDTPSRNNSDRFRNRETPMRDNKDLDSDRYKNRDRGREIPGRDNRMNSNTNRNDFAKERRRGDRKNNNRRSRSKDFKKREFIAGDTSKNEDCSYHSRESFSGEEKLDVEESPGINESLLPTDQMAVTPSAIVDVGSTHLVS